VAGDLPFRIRVEDRLDRLLRGDAVDVGLVDVDLEREIGRSSGRETEVNIE
jgi:hypothetical protein